MEDRNIVECILINKKNEFLLQKKTIDYRHGSGIWCLFGGEIKKGEKPEMNILEELNITE